MRVLELWAAGPTAPRERYAYDQAMIARVARGADTACLRVHCAGQAGVALGRFHRRDIQRRDGAAGTNLTRRATGGRSTPTGPGLIEVTMAVPAAGWLDPGSVTLRPEQVLNRALRPVLGALRAVGIDAFYPGRDLITVDSSPLAACSFNVLPDGVVLAEICIGVDQPLSLLPQRMRELDPTGVAAMDTGCFEGACTLARRGDLGLDQGRWVATLAEAAETSWGCTVNTWGGRPDWLATFTPPAEAAYAAFLAERVAQQGRNVRTAASMTMLGVVEASARIVNGHVRQLEIGGDVIAPAMTLSALGAACEGVVAAGPALRRAVTAVLSEQRHFLLGFDGVDDLLRRLL